jgi:lysophospholipase L1-like esterase
MRKDADSAETVRWGATGLSNPGQRALRCLESVRRVMHEVMVEPGHALHPSPYARATGVAGWGPATTRTPLPPVIRASAFVAVAVLASMLAFAIVAAATRPAVLFLGDSVTAGYGARDAAAAFPALVDPRALVDGEPGAPSGVFVGRSWRAATAVVELGINDYVLGVSVDAYRDNMAAVLASLSADRVVVVVPYEIGARRAGTWDAYADALVAVAARDARVRVVDLRTAFGAPDTRLLDADLIHPNDRGHALIARLVAAAIQP